MRASSQATQSTRKENHKHKRTLHSQRSGTAEPPLALLLPVADDGLGFDCSGAAVTAAPSLLLYHVARPVLLSGQCCLGQSEAYPIFTIKQLRRERNTTDENVNPRLALSNQLPTLAMTPHTIPHYFNKSNFSKSVDYLLAGMDTPKPKIKKAEKNARGGN